MMVQFDSYQCGAAVAFSLQWQRIHEFYREKIYIKIFTNLCWYTVLELWPRWHCQKVPKSVVHEMTWHSDTHIVEDWSEIICDRNNRNKVAKYVGASCKSMNFKPGEMLDKFNQTQSQVWFCDDFAKQIIILQNMSNKVILMNEL